MFIYFNFINFNFFLNIKTLHKSYKLGRENVQVPYHKHRFYRRKLLKCDFFPLMIYVKLTV